MDIAKLGLGEAIGLAREGNVTQLVARLRDPAVVLLQIERDYLADLLEGKARRPAHRPRTRSLAKFGRAVRVVGLHSELVADGWPRDAARDRCAELLGISRSSVDRAMKMLGS